MDDDSLVVVVLWCGKVVWKLRKKIAFFFTMMFANDNNVEMAITLIYKVEGLVDDKLVELAVEVG